MYKCRESGRTDRQIGAWNAPYLESFRVSLIMPAPDPGSYRLTRWLTPNNRSARRLIDNIPKLVSKHHGTLRAPPPFFMGQMHAPLKKWGRPKTGEF
jgi:hypothetical protein